MNYNRQYIASLIVKRLEVEKHKLQTEFKQSGKIQFFVLDNVLPEELATVIFNNFPETKDTVSKKNLKEHKHVAFQMNKYASILEETIYAFQDEKVVCLVEEICGLKNIFPDEHLYAGGLSLMEKNNFLNPHLDNSHDKDRKNWRVLNLLYYVTPNWKNEYGGNLELWPNGVEGNPITVDSSFNRLVVMATHKHSWHSVSKVTVEKTRCCVSNYYFSDEPLFSSDSFHVTSFRGRPTEKLRDFILRKENALRMVIRKIFKKGIRENPHKYKK